MQLNGTPYVLVMLHRPSNVDVKENLEKLLDAFEVVEQNLKNIFPIHPRTIKRINRFALEQTVKSNKNLILTELIGYLDFMKLMHNSKFCLTDSGGI
jgi:UDP-N-acetylglucosamine 2-epimerase (non-hydrolysing)